MAMMPWPHGPRLHFGSECPDPVSHSGREGDSGGSNPYRIERGLSELTGAVGSLPFELLVAEFTSRWQRGEAPSVEPYLDRLGTADAGRAVELIYTAYCLA